jgi:hypothetical protein
LQSLAWCQADSVKWLPVALLGTGMCWCCEQSPLEPCRGDRFTAPASSRAVQRHARVSLLGTSASYALHRCFGTHVARERWLAGCLLQEDAWEFTCWVAWFGRCSAPQTVSLLQGPFYDVFAISRMMCAHHVAVQHVLTSTYLCAQNTHSSGSSWCACFIACLLTRAVTLLQLQGLGCHLVGTQHTVAAAAPNLSTSSSMPLAAWMSSSAQASCRPGMYYLYNHVLPCTTLFYPILLYMFMDARHTS